MKRLYVEVSAEAVVVHVPVKGNEYETARFLLPEGAWGDGAAMARPAAAFLRGKIKFPARWEAVVTVAARRSVIRLVKPFEYGETAVDWERRYFPYGEKCNGDTHVFGREMVPGAGGGVWFMTALPSALAGAVVEMCGAWGIPVYAVRRIGIWEHTLALYYGGVGAGPLWLFTPLEEGVRLLYLYDGRPVNVYFISQDAAYRQAELDRIFLADGFPPEAGRGIWVRSPADGESMAAGGPDTARPASGPFDWLLAYFERRGCTVTTGFVPVDIRRKAADG